jgi:hypothetical protein
VQELLIDEKVRKNGHVGRHDLIWANTLIFGRRAKIFDQSKAVRSAQCARLVGSPPKQIEMRRELSGVFRVFFPKKCAK